MKISDEEVNAALTAWDGPFENVEGRIRSTLKAAYTVRKARKAAKRAKANQKQTVYHVSLGEIDFNALRRQWSLNPAQAVPEPSKPEQPEHRFKVGDRVYNWLCGAGTVTAIDDSDALTPYRVKFHNLGNGLASEDALTPEPAAPAWNGKFEVGKAYRMRNGKRAIITFKRDVDEWVLQGETDTHTRLWRLNGRWGNSAAGTEASDTEYDLIRPWED